MPRKVRLPASREDNRLSQQRSRARQREYVADLERRISEYEIQGVQATIEVQRAAQAVAAKNEKLLALLALRGVQQEEIDAFLSSPGTATETSLEPGFHSAGPSLATQLPSSQVQARSPAGKCTGRAKCSRSSELETPITSSSLEVQICNPFRETRAKDSAASTATCENLVSEVTSCDTAATIIAGLRGNGDIAEARQALGCPNSAGCSVKNTDLFQLMDQVP